MISIEIRSSRASSRSGLIFFGLCPFAISGLCPFAISDSVSFQIPAFGSFRTSIIGDRTGTLKVCHEVIHGLRCRHGISGLDGLVCNVGVDHAPDSLVISLNYFGTVDLLVGLRDALAWGKQPAAVTSVSNSMLITPGIPEDMVEALLQGDEGRALELLKDHPGKAYASSNLDVRFVSP